MDIQEIIHDYLQPINQIKSANILLAMENVTLEDRLKLHKIIEDAAEKLIKKTDDFYVKKSD